MDENKELEKIVEEAIKSRLEEQRMTGIIIGWNACLAAIKNEIKDLHSAKKIKQLIKEKIEESEERVRNNIKGDAVNGHREISKD